MCYSGIMTSQVVPRQSEGSSCSQLLPSERTCDHVLCTGNLESSKCANYCILHCCSFTLDHGNEMAKKFARDEPKRLTYLRCNRNDCRTMRVRTCAMYCREHCCWGAHERHRKEIEKSCKRGRRMMFKKGQKPNREDSGQHSDTTISQEIITKGSSSLFGTYSARH